jgi:pilus assembly protein Flp/PilA
LSRASFDDFRGEPAIPTATTAIGCFTSQQESCVMKQCVEFLLKLGRDEEGTALVEYSILLGLIALVTIGLAVGIGEWVGARFSKFCSALNGSGVGTCASGSGS